MKNIAYCLLGLALLCVAGCSSKNDVAQVSPETLQAVSKIVVVPTEIATTEGTLSQARAAQLGAGATYIDDVLRSELYGTPKIVFASDSYPKSELPSVTGGIWGEIQKLGERMNADAVLVVSLNQYKDRNGGTMSVESPASASFVLRLISTTNGHVLWASSFEETQQSFMSDVLSFGKVVDRGFKWITVEEMVSEALKKKLTECPYLFAPAVSSVSVGKEMETVSS